MNDFYLNKQFFDFLIDKSYPLGKDFYLHVYSRQTIGSGYKKFYRYVDSQLRSFCEDHDLDYEPISDDKYSIWLSAKFQSK